MELVDALLKFRLDELPPDLVENRWRSDFSEEIELPYEVSQNIDKDSLNELIIEAIDAIKSWQNEEKRSSVGSELDVERTSWQFLINSQINIKALVCILSTVLKTNVKEYKGNFERILLALNASRLYINLLTIPGAIVFNAFNSDFFDLTLNVFKLGSLFGSVKTKKSKNSNNALALLENALGGPGEEDGEEDRSENNLNETNKKVILQNLCLLLQELSLCLKEIQLKQEINSLEPTVKHLVSLTRLEVENNILTGNLPRINTISFVARTSYLILEQLCTENHGEIGQTIYFIMKAFVPSLVINEQNMKMFMSDKGSVKQHTFFFIHKLLNTFENEAVDPVTALFQQLCIQVPDKADIRAKAVPEIVELMEPFPPKLFMNLVLWVTSLIHTNSIRHRVTGAEIACKLLSITDKTDEKCLHRLLLAAAISGSQDLSPIARYKNLNTVSGALFSNQPEVKEIVTNLITDPDVVLDEREVVSTDFFDFYEFLDEVENKNGDISLTDFRDKFLPPGHRILKLFEKLATDEKVYVRKSALQGLSNILSLNEKWISEIRLKIIVKHCKDMSVMIRKQMAKCLTDLIATYPSCEMVISAWIEGVIYLIADSDSKSQEKIVEYVGQVIIENIVHHNEAVTPESKLPWLVLSKIAEKDIRNLFRIICRSWVQENKIISKYLLRNVKTYIGTEYNYEAWYLFLCLSEFMDLPDSDFIFDYYFEHVHKNEEIDEELAHLVVENLFLNLKLLSNHQKDELYSELRAACESFKIPYPLIGRALDMCVSLKHEETRDWCRETLKKLCEDFILSEISPNSGCDVDEVMLCQHICTLGNAANLAPGVTTEVIDYIGHIIAPDFFSDGNITKWNGQVSDRVRALGIVTVGKICLQNHLIAKKYVPTLASLLNNLTSSVAVKINSLTALADLCIRFTSVVEDFLGEMCITLKDRSLSVRRNTLSKLLDLIQQDYLKLRSPLFFYLLITLLDPSPVIRELTESFIINIVLERNPNIMCNFFITTVFFFNNFEDERCSKENLSSVEKKLFNMSGITYFSSRKRIYVFMLQHMKDDQRFKTSNRICLDILDKVSENKIELDVKGTAVLKDALSALACEDMRLENLRKGADDDEQPPDNNAQEVFMGVARKTLLTQLVKKNYIEHIVPTIVKLKHKLRDLKSPLLKDLMICLRELMKDYKEEINEILAADPELAAEVSYDLKHLPDNDTIDEDYGDESLREVRLQCQRISEVAFNENMNQILSDEALSELAQESNTQETSEIPTQAEQAPFGTPEKRDPPENRPKSLERRPVSPYWAEDGMLPTYGPQQPISGESSKESSDSEETGNTPDYSCLLNEEGENNKDVESSEENNLKSPKVEKSKNKSCDSEDDKKSVKKKNRSNAPKKPLRM